MSQHQRRRQRCSLRSQRNPCLRRHLCSRPRIPFGELRAWLKQAVSRYELMYSHAHAPCGVSHSRGGGARTASDWRCVRLRVSGRERKACVCMPSAMQEPAVQQCDFAL